MPEVVNTARARGWLPPRKGFWSLVPESFGLHAQPHTLAIDVRAFVPRKLAAIRRIAARWAPTIRFRTWPRPTRADGLTSLRRASIRDARHRPGAAMHVDLLEILRCPV